MARVGPVRLQVAGDQYLQTARVAAIVWDSNSTSGDTVRLVDPVVGAVLWSSRTDSTQTYLGLNIGPKGMHCPNGFQLQQISSGTLYVYLAED